MATAAHIAAGKDDHVIDIDDGAAPPPECAVCTELLEWVAVGACGHSAVCGTCAVRLRYVHEDHRCCICRTHCVTVIVTKAGGGGGETRALAELVQGPCISPAAEASMRYMYHSDTMAYFDDEEQYEAAEKACRDADVNYGRPPDCCCLPAVALLIFYIFLGICSLLSFLISITW